MLVLFINCHKKTEEGQLRFKHFYSTIKPLLSKTVYFGNQVTETIRTYDQLHDYIYDQVTFRMDQRNIQRFESLQYIIIDGNCSFAPWSDDMTDTLIIIRKSIEQGKKILCHGFGHFAAHFYLATQFDKHYKIAKIGSGKKVDFQWDETTGDLRLKGQKIANSGIKVTDVNRPFKDKSSQALSKGLTLSSKFQYVVFDGKSGSKLLKNVQLPFSFYWKSKLFCTTKTVSQVRADILLQTQKGTPIAFSCNNLLSIQGTCNQILKVVKNWLMIHSNRIFDHPISFSEKNNYQTIAFENKIQYRKALSSSASQLRSNLNASKRPQSSKFSTLDFQKPVVRCSGKYQTSNQRYIKEQIQKKSLNFGRNRMVFKGKLSEMEIGTYVGRQPSRPPSSHKFRDVRKEKWMGGQFANY